MYEFVKESLLLPDEELKAMEAQIPMTQELFERCLADLAKIDSVKGFNRIFREFPKQAGVYADKVRALAEDSGQLPGITAKKKDRIWQEICRRIGEEQGKSAV